jgi:hypothetical protein
MPNIHFKINEVKEISMINKETKEVVFTITPANQKFCFNCSARIKCAMQKLSIDYAKDCVRYPDGPGFNTCDEEYIEAKTKLVEALINEDSTLRKQLREILKLDISKNL